MKSIINYYLDQPMIRYTLYIFIVILILQIIYIFSTTFEKTIIINQKYTGTSGNRKRVSTKYMITDTDNNVYIVSNSIFYLKWDSAERWSTMKEGNSYKISGFGKRISFLQMYPTIMNIKTE